MKKSLLLSLICKVLGKGMVYVCANDSDAQKDVKCLPDGLVISLKILGEPEYLKIKKQGSVFVSAKDGETPNLEVVFKNRTSARMVFLGKIGVRECFSRHDILLSGNINLAVALVRIIEKTEYYLFPRFITCKFLPKMKKDFSSFKIYGYLLFGSSKNCTKSVKNDGKPIKSNKKVQKDDKISEKVAK